MKMRPVPEKEPNLLSRLKQAGIYHRLRASFVYDLYLKLTNRPLAKSRYREVNFYRALLNGFKQGDLIFDIGANAGDRSDVFLRIGARVVAVDPDARNQAILCEKFLRYRFSAKPVTIVGKAVGAKSGMETMLVCGSGSVFNTLSQKGADNLTGVSNPAEPSANALEFGEKKIVETTTLEELIETYGLPFFVKIDVVGFELEVMQGLHRPIPYLSFEIDMAAFRQELLRCIEILGGLSPRGQFNYTCDRRNGLFLEKWLDAEPFSQVLREFEGCREGCVEVFWRTISG